MKPILDLFRQIAEYRFAIFVVMYLMFSFAGAYNLAYLVSFCYIILLLEQIVAGK